MGLPCHAIHVPRRLERAQPQRRQESLWGISPVFPTIQLEPIGAFRFYPPWLHHPIGRCVHAGLSHSREGKLCWTKPALSCGTPSRQIFALSQSGPDLKWYKGGDTRSLAPPMGLRRPEAISLQVHLLLPQVFPEVFPERLGNPQSNSLAKLCPNVWPRRRFQKAGGGGGSP